MKREVSDEMRDTNDEIRFRDCLAGAITEIQPRGLGEREISVVDRWGREREERHNRFKSIT